MNLNKVISVLFSLLLLFVVACSKDSSQSLNPQRDNVEFSVNSTGLLEFSSLDDLYKASQLYINDQAFKVKIDRVFPKSLKTLISNVLETSKTTGVNASEREFSNFIVMDIAQGKPYSKVVFPFLHYSPFLTEDGVVIIDGVYVKFSKTYVASSKVLSKLSKINEVSAQNLISKVKEFQLTDDVLVSNIVTTATPNGTSTLRDESSGHGKYCANNGYDRLECWVIVLKTVIMNSSSDYDIAIDIITDARKDESPNCSECCSVSTGSWYGSTNVSGTVSVRLLPSNLLLTGGPISGSGSNTGYLGIASIPCFHYSNDWSSEVEFRTIFSFNVSGDMATGGNISFSAGGTSIL